VTHVTSPAGAFEQTDPIAGLGLFGPTGGSVMTFVLVAFALALPGLALVVIDD